MTTKVWNLMYALGNTGRVIGDAGNPQRRKSALEGAAVIEKNGWRVWVEHNATSKRIFESARESEHREAAEPERIVDSAKATVAGHQLTSGTGQMIDIQAYYKKLKKLYPRMKS